jgi:hypothetical protein
MRSRKGMHTDRDAWRNLAVTPHAAARPESLVAFVLYQAKIGIGCV